jgi:hypothetical protein
MFCDRINCVRRLRTLATKFSQVFIRGLVNHKTLGFCLETGKNCVFKTFFNFGRSKNIKVNASAFHGLRKGLYLKPARFVGQRFIKVEVDLFFFRLVVVLIIKYKMGRWSSDLRIWQEMSLMFRKAKYDFKNKYSLKKKTLSRA